MVELDIFLGPTLFQNRKQLKEKLVVAVSWGNNRLQIDPKNLSKMVSEEHHTYLVGLDAVTGTESYRGKKHFFLQHDCQVRLVVVVVV